MPDTKNSSTSFVTPSSRKAGLQRTHSSQDEVISIFHSSHNMQNPQLRCNIKTSSWTIPVLIMSFLFLIITPASGDAIYSKQKVRLMAVGDIQLGSGTATQINRYGSPWVFEKVLPIFRQADFIVGNLESPLSTHNEPAQKRWVFRGDPKMARELRISGFNALSVANNHAFDHGQTALADTLKHLANAQLIAVGGGFGTEQPYKAKIVEINGIKIALIGAQNIGWYPVADSKAGIAMIDEKKLVGEIKEVRKSVDFIVIILHWGVEYTQTPTDKQRQLAHYLIDSGADLIFGHHPHIIQGIEHYKNGFIAYSLGNFVFNNDNDLACRTIILSIDLNPNGTLSNLMVAPISIRNFRPEPNYTPDGEKTLGILTECGKKLGANGITRFHWIPLAEYISSTNMR